MKDLLSFNGYSGSIEVSIEDNCLHGKILFINDLVTYEADTVQDLQVEFQNAVSDYLEMCKDKGLSPDKPFSGTFNVRIGPELHQAAVKAAYVENVSLNDFVKSAVKDRLDKSEDEIVHHHHYYHEHSHVYKSEFRKTLPINIPDCNNWINSNHFRPRAQS